MKKLHLFKTVLLLCALIVGSVNGWADSDPYYSFETVSTGGNSSPHNSYTAAATVEIDGIEWSVMGNSNQAIWRIGGKGSNTNAADREVFSMTAMGSAISKVVLTVGTADNITVNSLKLIVASDADFETQIDEVTATFAANSDIDFTPTSPATEWSKDAYYKFVFNLSVSGNSNKFVQFKGASFYAPEDSKTATTTTITYTGITNTYINQGTAAGSLSAAVTETESEDAVEGATVTWSSSNTDVATIDDDGTVTLVAVGKTDLTATYAGDETYAGSSAKYTLTVTDTRADAEFSFDKASYSCDKFETFAAPTLNKAEGFDGTVVYSSSDEDVATVNASTGAVTIKTTGTTIISANSDATTNFQAGHAEYTLTVTIHDGLDPVDPAGVGRYVKVTSTEDITDGDYLIVYEGDATHDAVAFDGSRETLDAESNTIAVEISEGAIAATDVTNAAVFTIDVTAGTIKSASDFYIGVSSNSNGLKQTEDAETYTHTFSIDNESGNAIITAVFEGSSMTMQYNYASNQARFRYFKSLNQQPIQLYKYEAGSAAKVTLSADGYKTMVGTQPFSASGANIYIVTATDTEKATMTKITKAPANTPVILKGESNAEVSLSVEDAGDNASANLLQISTESTGNGVYVLAKKDDVVAFYEWDGGSLGTGRVYLPKPASGDAREMISFYFEDEETTGINTTLTTNERMNNEVYNLNGQRVAQPTKGLYIVNGKKYIVK